VITQPLLRITTEVRGGGLSLITRPGIVVEGGDISQHGGSVTLPLHPAGRDAHSGSGCPAPRVPRHRRLARCRVPDGCR
jgi:hypothetical protein